MNLFCFISRQTKKFHRDQSGAVLVEVLLTLPFLTILAIGILEFGNVFWQREQIETGLRDATRYLARCPSAALFDCEAIARNLAYFGSVDGSGPPRVPAWNIINSPITFTRTEVGVPEGGDPSQAIYQVITASTTHSILHSTLFPALQTGGVTIAANHNQRIIGR